jgi:hypothetical protein
MSSISINKFGENLPVTSVVALSQVAFGLGAGLLLANKLGSSARQRAGIALMGAGAAAVVPVVAGIVTHINNRPGSRRDMQRRLASIRRDTGLSNGEETY